MVPADKATHLVHTLMQQAAEASLEQASMLRSVGVVFDWHDDLNSQEGTPTGLLTDRVGELRPDDVQAVRGLSIQISKIQQHLSELMQQGLMNVDRQLVTSLRELELARKRLDVERSKKREAAHDQEEGTAEKEEEEKNSRIFSTRQGDNTSKEISGAVQEESEPKSSTARRES